MNAITRRAVVACIAITGYATAAAAHHSFRAYDLEKSVTVAGTIKEFRWGAPHSSLILTYQNKGKRSSMSLGSASPMVFIKQGFQPRDFKAGDKVTVTYHPNVSGLPGGFMSKLTTPTGKVFSDTEIVGQAGPRPAPAKS